MREEISEPKQWRAATSTKSARNQSWTTRRRAQAQAELAADAVDAALTEHSGAPHPAEQHVDAQEIIASLATQLELLEKQREQIQDMLDQVQGS